MSNTATLSLARHAIFDDDVRVCGYELVYRSAQADNGSSVLNLAAELRDIGLDSIVGDVPVWVDLGDAPLTHDLSEAFEPARTVVQVFPETAARPDVVDSVSRLRADGYRVA